MNDRVSVKLHAGLAAAKMSQTGAPGDLWIRLGLSRLAANRLVTVGCYTIEDARRLNPRDLVHATGLGVNTKSYREIATLLEWVDDPTTPSPEPLDMTEEEAIAVQRVMEILGYTEQPKPSTPIPNLPPPERLAERQQIELRFYCPTSWLPRTSTLQMKVEYGVAFVKPGGLHSHFAIRVLRRKKNFLHAMINSHPLGRIGSVLRSGARDDEGLYAINAPQAHGWCALDLHTLRQKGEPIDEAIQRLELAGIPFVHIRALPSESSDGVVAV